MVRAHDNVEPSGSPTRVDDPGHLALGVASQVGGYKFRRVLMDGVSNINILYYDTFRLMELTDKELKPCATVFHGVVPGKSAYPTGKIALEVAFGEDPNYRVETLWFEVGKIKSPYHGCSVGRLMLNLWPPLLCVSTVETARTGGDNYCARRP